MDGNAPAQYCKKWSNVCAAEENGRRMEELRNYICSVRAIVGCRTIGRDYSWDWVLEEAVQGVSLANVTGFAASKSQRYFWWTKTNAESARELCDASTMRFTRSDAILECVGGFVGG